MAVGNPYGGDTLLGRVKVYEWDGLTSTWNGLYKGTSLFGVHVSIGSAPDALTLAVGAPRLNGGHGVARVYKWN